MEILHSSAVEATGPRTVSIYASAESKEAKEIFSKLSTLFDKGEQLSLDKVHKACQRQRKIVSKCRTKVLQ